jgi:hypothetical protein
MPHLALYTFGVLKAPLHDPASCARDFLDSAEGIYRQIGLQPGYIARAEAADNAPATLFDADWGAWGEFVVPAWYGKGRTAETTALAATLSLWSAVRPAFDVIYTGLHRAALNRRYDWFERSGNPGYVLWWVAEGEIPTWQDGVARLNDLQEHGSTSYAFTFHHPFDAGGTPTSVKGVEPEERAR